MPPKVQSIVDAPTAAAQSLNVEGGGLLPNLDAALAALNRSLPPSPGRDGADHINGADTEAEDDDEQQSQIPREQPQQSQDNGLANGGAPVPAAQPVKKAPAKSRSAVLATPTLAGGFATLPDPHPNTGGPLKQAIDVINRNAHAGGQLSVKFDAGTVGPQDERCVERLDSAHAAIKNLSAELRDISRKGAGVEDCDVAAVKGTVDELVTSLATLQLYVADVANIAMGATDAFQTMSEDGNVLRREIAECKRDIAELKGMMRVRNVTGEPLPALPISSPAVPVRRPLPVLPTSPPTVPTRRPPTPTELISPAAKRAHVEAHDGGANAGRSAYPGLYVGPYAHFSGKNAAARLSEVCAMLNQLEGARTRASPWAATANENDSFATVYYRTVADRDSALSAWPPNGRKYETVTVEKADNLPPPEQEPVRAQRNFARGRGFGTRV